MATYKDFELLLTVRADLADARQQMQAFGDSEESVARASKLAQDAIAQLNTQFATRGPQRDMRAGMESISTTLQRVTSWLSRLYIVMQSARVVSDLAAQSDAWVNLNSQLRLVTGSQGELLAVRQRLIDSANATGSSLEATATLYTRLSRALSSSGASTDQMLDFTDTLNKAMVVSGATSTEASNGLIQLSQAMATGVLRGQDFRSVSEQIPVVLRLVEQATGKTRGELIKMAYAGELTASTVFQAVLNGAQQINAQYSTMPLTIGRATQALKNQFEIFIGEGSQASGIGNAVAHAIAALAQNMDALATVLGGVVVVAMTRVGGVFVQHVLKTGAAAEANRLLAASELQIAQRQEATALATLRALQGRMRLTVATADLTIAEDAYAAAQARTAAAGAAAAEAGAARAGMLGRLGSGALALGGGWVGVAALAVAGLGYVIYKQVEAEKAWQQSLVDNKQAVQALAEKTADFQAQLHDPKALAPPTPNAFIEQAHKINAAITETVAKLEAARAKLDESKQRDDVPTAAAMADLMGIADTQADTQAVKDLESELSNLQQMSTTAGAAMAQMFAPTGDELAKIKDRLSHLDFAGALAALQAVGDRVRGNDAAARAFLPKIDAMSTDLQGKLAVAGKSAAQSLGEFSAAAIMAAIKAGYSATMVENLAAKLNDLRVMQAQLDADNAAAKARSKAEQAAQARLQYLKNLQRDVDVTAAKQQAATQATAAGTDATVAATVAGMRYDEAQQHLSATQKAVADALIDKRAQQLKDTAATTAAAAAAKQSATEWAHLQQQFGAPLQPHLEQALAAIDQLNAAMATGPHSAADYQQVLAGIFAKAVPAMPRDGLKDLPKDPMAEQLQWYQRGQDAIAKVRDKALADDAANQAKALAQDRAYQSQVTQIQQDAQTQQAALATQHAQAMTAIKEMQRDTALQAANEGFLSLAQAYAKAYGDDDKRTKAAFALHKAAAIAQAIISIRIGALKAIEMEGIWGVIQMAATIAAGAASLMAIRNATISGYATGGAVRGPGTGTSDSVPIWASHGEYVQRAAAVSYYGADFMDAVNSMSLPRFASGGLVGVKAPSLGKASALPSVNMGQLVVSPVTVIVNASGGDAVKSKQSTGSNGAQLLELFIGAAAQNVMQGGKLDKALNQKYTLNRKGQKYG